MPLLPLPLPCLLRRDPHDAALNVRRICNGRTRNWPLGTRVALYEQLDQPGLRNPRRWAVSIGGRLVKVTEVRRIGTDQFAIVTDRGVVRYSRDVGLVSFDGRLVRWAT